MSGKMWRDLKLGPLDDRNLPSVVGANGSSLGVLGRIRCTIAFEKDEDKFDQTFLVCENLQRGVILGKDFARQNCAGVYWTPHNTRVLHTNLDYCRNQGTHTKWHSSHTRKTDNETTTKESCCSGCQHQHNQQGQDQDDTR